MRPDLILWVAIVIGLYIAFGDQPEEEESGEESDG